jgi:hypothetical protein
MRDRCPSVPLAKDYRSEKAQFDYVHHYLVKIVGIWSAMRLRLERVLVGEPRRLLDKPDLDLWSIGGGSQFCLAGWMYSCDPLRLRRATIVDPNEWTDLVGLPAHKAMMREILGTPRIDTVNAYLSAGGKPPQLGGYVSSPWTMTGVSEKSVVLSSFMMGHMIGSQSAGSVSVSELARALQELRTRSGLVVVVDYAKWPSWPELAASLGAGFRERESRSWEGPWIKQAFWSSRELQPWEKRVQHASREYRCLVGEPSGSWWFVESVGRPALPSRWHEFSPR